MDLERFLNSAFSLREEAVKVPELRNVLFDQGEKAEWVVRGLTAAELGRAEEAASRRPEDVKAIVTALAGSGDKAEAIQQMLGVSGKDVPADVSRRIELLVAGSVSPELSADKRDVAVRLAETFPTTFYKLTNSILSLTGRGAELGKRKPSGKTQKSAK